MFPGTKYVEKVEKKEGSTAFQNIKDLTNHNLTKYNQIRKQPFWRICALTKSLPLKLISLQVPLIKILVTRDKTLFKNKK